MPLVLQQVTLLHCNTASDQAGPHICWQTHLPHRSACQLHVSNALTPPWAAQVNFLPLGSKEVREACETLKITRQQVADRQQQHSYQRASSSSSSSEDAVPHGAHEGDQPRNGSRKQGKVVHGQGSDDHAGCNGHRSDPEEVGNGRAADLSGIWHRAESRYSLFDNEARDGPRAEAASSASSSGLSGDSSSDAEVLPLVNIPFARAYVSLIRLQILPSTS